MRRLVLSLSLCLLPIAAADAQVSIGIAVPGVSIGINLPVYPSLVRVPGYPVYYDPRGSSNYFFYDGQYWVYRDDTWYASTWYNGPWLTVQPAYVPLYVLRVPVRYYRQPPTYFRGWRADSAPRWGDHYGRDWESQRSGWNTWNRNAVPRAAPLPTYQRQYSGDRYPGAIEQQREIRTRSYSYQPRESINQQHYQQPPQQQYPRPQQQQPQQQQPQQYQQPPQQYQRPPQPSQAPQQQPYNAPGNATQDRGPRNESQGKGRDDRPESQGKGRDDRPESQGKGRDHNKD